MFSARQYANVKSKFSLYDVWKQLKNKNNPKTWQLIPSEIEIGPFVVIFKKSCWMNENALHSQKYLYGDSQVELGC